MTPDQVRKDIGYIRSKLSGRDGKYNRNLDLYQFNGYRMSDIWTVYGQPAGYINPLMGPDGPITQYNFTKSIVDAFISKISDAKVRPFFNPLEGSRDVRKAAKQTQERIDDIWDNQNVYSKSIYALRDAFVFERGDIWINDIKSRVEKIMPWNYEIDPAEYATGCVSRCIVRQKQYPLVAILDRLDKSKEEAAKKTLLDSWKENRDFNGEYTVYYDLYSGERFEFFDTFFLLSEKIKFTKVNGLMVEPVVEFWYNKPVKGYFTTSMVDDLYSLQWGRDNMQRRFDEAVRRGLFNFILVPEGSGLKSTDIENKAATAYTFLPSEGGGQPVVVTPQFVHAQLIEILDLYEQWGMKMVGLSGLDVHAEKQSGLDSGKAIQTMENIASDRHNTILQMFVQKQVEIAKRILDVMPDTSDILPKKQGREQITWAEIRKARELIEIQFSAGSAMSKDPATKAQQIDAMMATGVFDDNRKAQFMEMPDLEEAYSLATVASDYCDWVIDNWADDNKVEFVPVVSLEMMRTEIQKAMMRYSMAGDDTKIVTRLTELLNRVTSYEDEASEGMGPAPALPPGIPAPLPSGPMPPPMPVMPPV